MRIHLPILTGLLVSLFAVVLYVWTLAPSVMPGDYAEFQMSAAVLGVPHPTGYPLYIILGKLFTLLPFGDVAYRVNLSSAAYMAAAAGVLYAIAARLIRLMRLEGAWWAAGVGALFFAVSPTVWSMSLVARSYALNALLVGGVVFCLLAWRHTERPRWFYASCLLIGLSMVHHGTTYLLLPAYGLYLLLVEVERHRRASDNRPMLRRVLGVLSLLAGLSPLLFLVYRFLGGAPYYWGNPTTWGDFFSLLTGGPFHNQVLGFGSGLSEQLERVAFGVGELSGQYTPLGIAAGLIGLVVLWRLKRAEAVLLTLMLLGNFFFAMNYSLVGYLYFIPTYLLWGVLIGIGLGWLSHVVFRNLGKSFKPTVVGAGLGVVAVMLLGVIGYSVGLRYPNIDQSGQTATRDEALALLDAAPQGASLFMDWEDVSVIRFYRLVYGMRPDLTIHTGDPADWAKGVYCALNNGSAAYVGEFAGAQPPVIARDFTLESAPMGWRVVDTVNGERYRVPPCGTCATCR